MEFVIFILAICIVILFSNFYNLKRENNFIKSIIARYSEESSFMKNELAALKKLLDGRTISPKTDVSKEELTIPDVEIVPEIIQEIVVEDTSIRFTPIVEEVVESKISEEILEPIAVPVYEEPIIAFENQTSNSDKQDDENLKQVQIKEYEESGFSKFMKTAEKQFADNWTGILGTAIMVLGIGYLSIYTALKVAPLFRVLILWLYAGLLVGSYFFLQKKEKWITTGLWLRSAGASLFLFGCFGASQIPALSFITNPIYSYALIGVGISLNLYVGYIIKKQTFLSLHVILSMLILCVIPDKTLATFILASITATIGIILSFKEKWEYHLLIVIAAFIVFDIWFNAQGTKLTLTENIFAILGIIAVAGSCMVMQYRSFYENTIFEKTAFITHLTNWILFATGLILHSTGSRFKTFVLFIGSLVCLFITTKARKRKIYWLYHLDGMIAFVLLALSIITLNEWQIGIDIIACVLYLVILFCLFLVYKTHEILLHKIFLAINHLFGIGLVIFGSLIITNSLSAKIITNSFLTSAVLFIIGISIPIISSIKKEFSEVDSFFGKKSLSLNGIFAMFFSAFVIINSDYNLPYNSFVYVLIAFGLIWAFLRKKYNNSTFEIGRIIYFILTLLVGIFIIEFEKKSYYDWTFGLGLVLVAVLNWTCKHFYKNDFFIRFVGIIGVNILMLVLVGKYLPNYQIIQIFGLFGIALLNHEFLWINFKKNSLTTINQAVLYLVYYIFSIIASLLFLYHSADFTNSQIGLMCLGIIAIEIYVLFAKRIRHNSEETAKEWTNFNKLNSELILLNIILFGCSCIQTEYLSVYFAAFTILLFIAFQKFNEFKRYHNYSFFFLIASMLLTIYIAVDNVHEKGKLIIYLIQTSTILLSVVYSYLLLNSKDEKGKRFVTFLPYIQNLWIVILLFIQVEIAFLPLSFMALALLNYWFISKEKIKIEIHFVPVIAMLAVVVSCYYSFDKLNDFTLIDWITQLSSIALGLLLVILLNKKEPSDSMKTNYQIVLNIWISIVMFSQIEHKWLPVFWAATAILNLYLYFKKISKEKNISIVYYLFANLHLGFLSFNYYESKFLAIYLLIFMLLAVYIYLAYKWIEEFKLKNSLLIYPATLSIGCFLYLTFDKGILTLFWILEALGLLILGIILKEKYFRYVSLSLVGICVIRLMFFDLSNADFLIRALVLLGVGVVLLVMNSLFKKYKDRFE